MDRAEFRENFRVSRTSFTRLLSELEPHIYKQTTNFGEHLSAEVRLVFIFLLRLAMEFEEGYGIPGCVGALDGCQIPIAHPAMKNSRKFFNRKGFYSLNMSAIVDRNRRFLDIDVKWPGSVGDNRVFSNSTVGRVYEEYFVVAGGEEGAGLLPSGWAEYQKIPFFPFGGFSLRELTVSSHHV
ncbi:Nuclease HARBI1 [Phytophthora megakarya]|uniref:Nuclease HARBI1 n=1 Tax=Phytophthora megakarya TaxID=4795 RepID=A0A225V0Z0_9STRA|nr:Nuclease HARBI1 [Phytophthora megakarya]